jgi:lipid II:glycine glycyltransferase (peptidoglycan interpeptide bridge formation enzyme)
VYNFWGIAPLRSSGSPNSQFPIPKHPFAGVTTFKTGFGGELLELEHCMDLPLSKKYFLTWGIETVRKWRRGF